ncbi:MAG: hypothetical protein ABSA92_15750 [Candidatus Bathyarchaeia archaeon]
MHRRSLVFVLFIFLICGSSSALFAQTDTTLQLIMIGNGAGPYYAPVGQTSQLKIEILNLGPSDVFLVRGEAYLDPDLSGNWLLTHSEDLGNFHLAKLESAIWTFELPMPSHVQAQNITNGVPQVELLAKIMYSTSDAKQQSAEGQFLLSVPGAALHTDYSVYLIILGFVLVAVVVIIVRNVRSRSMRKAQS